MLSAYLVFSQHILESRREANYKWQLCQAVGRTREFKCTEALLVLCVELSGRRYKDDDRGLVSLFEPGIDILRAGAYLKLLYNQELQLP